MKSFISIIFIFSIFILSCKDDTTSPPINNSDTSITLTDEFGNILGGDTTDWCYHQPQDSFKLYAAYPNPTNGPAFTLKVFIPRQDYISFYYMITPTDTVFLVRNLNTVHGTFTFHIDTITTGKYRIYFKTLNNYANNDPCNYYGDIMISQ